MIFLFRRGRQLPNSLFAIALLVLVSSACERAPEHEHELAGALQAITGEAVRSHMEVLASDGMQGRETGTAAFRQAADYVAMQFRAAGLQPLGDDGTYFREVDFFETRLVTGSASMTLHGDNFDETLHFGRDFIRAGGFGELHESITAPLVFVGFGIVAPEYGHDDFAGVDVSGKILVVLTGAPPTFAHHQRAFYSSSLGKQARAVELGAVGIVTIRTPVDQERLPWQRLLAGVRSADMRWIGADGIPCEAFPELVGDAALSESGAERLFTLAGRDLGALFEHHDSGATGSFELGVSATLSRTSAQTRIRSPNVLGLIQGDDPGLRDEYILYTAHLDHLGVRPGNEGDEIHNGAYDNAAGVAALLEIASAMSDARAGLRRSVIFAALTAEEMGLQGSDHLAHHPPVPIVSVVANINIDMPFLGFPIADVIGLGVEHSTLHDVLRRAAERLDLMLTPDPRPELVRLIRSDQFSFVKRGIPGLNLKPGTLSSDAAIDGVAMHAAFLQDHYHGPSDDLELPYSTEGAERFVRTALLMGWIVANGDERPRWKPGDFFGERFAEGR